MAASARPLKYLLGWLIAGTRGGATRARIIEILKETPECKSIGDSAWNGLQDDKTPSWGA